VKERYCGSGAQRVLPPPLRDAKTLRRPIVVKADRRDQRTGLSELRNWPDGYHKASEG
jgi:hypothetical protein